MIRKNLFSIQRANFSNSSILKNKINNSIKLKFNPYIEKDEFKNTYVEKHPHYHKFIKPVHDLVFGGFKFGWFSADRDTQNGAGRWNCNGIYPNKLASLLYRSKILQRKSIMNFVAKYSSNHLTEFNKAEEQPQITTNSVFLYKDNSNYFVNRRGYERLFLAFVLAQGVTPIGAIGYLFIGCYFALIVRFNKVNGI